MSRKILRYRIGNTKKENDYRIVCAMDYPRHTMYIKFVGTHDEYDAINIEEVK